MSQVTLKQIEAFVHVADLGTFRRAAERLGTTQPNISARIADLEARLGVVLMERDAGSVRLTVRGQALLGPARQVLGAVDGFLAASAEGAVFTGVLRLGVSEMVAHTWLRPFLAQMRERFPALDVELTVDLSASLSRALFARDLDLALQSGPFEQPSRGHVALGASPYVWVAAPDLAVGLRAEDLACHRIFTHARGSAPFRQLEEHFRATGQAARLVPASNIGACMQMALDGLGIACLPEAMLTEPLRDARLRRIDYPWQPGDLVFAARWNLDPTPSYVAAAAAIARSLFPPGRGQDQEQRSS